MRRVAQSSEKGRCEASPPRTRRVTEEKQQNSVLVIVVVFGLLPFVHRDAQVQTGNGVRLIKQPDSLPNLLFDSTVTSAATIAALAGATLAGLGLLASARTRGFQAKREE